MRRIRLTVEYDGTDYAGWQRQENALAVQEVVERALARLTGEKAALTGASRTDAGVHALGQTAHFDTMSRIPAEKFSYALNTLLPGDVRISDSREVSPDFHARFSARGKRYRYQIDSAPHAGALTRKTHWHVIYPLDLALMREEAQTLLGRHDFRAFAASGSTVKDAVREIHRAEILQCGREFVFWVEGTGFLYNMVRILAGTLVGVGSGKMAPGAFARALQTGDRLCLGVTAPAHGLTLMQVYYDGDEWSGSKP